MTDPETIKAMRSLLRRVDEHDQAVAYEEGAQRQSLNMLDVVYHPSNPLPNLNYVTPRRGAAWVSTNAVEQGLQRLAELGRAPRLLYFEGLMPAIFRQALAEFGLQWAGESPILATSELAGLTPEPTLFDSHEAAEPNALARWWQARNDMLAGRMQRQADASIIERMARMCDRGQSLYLSIEVQNQIVGLASLRVESQLRSAEINAFHHSDGDMASARALMASALRSAMERGCDLVFIAEAMGVQAWLSEFGFSRLGSVVAFAARLNQQETFHDRVAQPLQP